MKPTHLSALTTDELVDIVYSAPQGAHSEMAIELARRCAELSEALGDRDRTLAKARLYLNRLRADLHILSSAVAKLAQVAAAAAADNGLDL